MFLVTTIYHEAHATIYADRDEREGRCTQLFPMYWTEIHFLMRNKVYVYKEEDLTSEDLYQKKQHISFIDDLGYLGGNIPQEEAGQKCLKHLIDIQLLMEAHSREGMMVFW